jgi:hypothetical protein
MKSSHSVGFYFVAAIVSSAEVRLRRALKKGSAGILAALFGMSPESFLI